eukprot:scaffold50_cov420-Prasinococcus_capsulatus_cf.AAC.12
MFTSTCAATIDQQISSQQQRAGHPAVIPSTLGMRESQALRERNAPRPSRAPQEWLQRSPPQRPWASRAPGPEQCTP